MDLLSSSAPPEHVAVLRADPDLARRIDPERRRRAEAASSARLIRRERGAWDARDDADAGRDGAGLLIVSGLLVRRVGVADRYGGELLGEGDVLQPWQHDGEEATVPFEAGWRVLEELRLAVLDGNWMARMAPYPSVASALIGRALVRSRRLATMQAIAQHRRLDERLLLVLGELADRYGRMTPAGVRLELGLTPEMNG
jgi:hypothetical protein